MENSEFLRNDSEASGAEAPFDYAFVETIGRIALYDDLRSAPRITEIQPAETTAYIEALASTIHRQSQDAGGSISYTIIREVAENFIHAHFKEVVVSILDHGNTIRFADHGPGITSKEKAQKPGFSSAVEPMKNYIRGVGSGLPIVKEYLELSHGTITIEDNLGTGAVVTISLVSDETANENADQAHVSAATPAPAAPMAAVSEPVTATQPMAQPGMAAGYPTPSAAVGTAAPYPQGMPAQPMMSPQPAYNPYGGAYGAPAAYPYPPMTTMPRLKEKEKEFLKLLAVRAPLANKDFQELTGTPASTTSTTLANLAKQGLIESTGSQRWLSAYGQQVVSLL